MKLVFNILFLMAVVYYTYRFVQLLIKMNQTIIVPATDSEKNAVRIFPQKVVNSPTYSKQKWGIILYSFMLLFVIAMFIIGWDLNWSYQLLLLLPLVHSRNSFNLFAIVEAGLLCGNRYIAWKQIKSFQIIPIDQNHRYYGYTKEVNEGYEFIIKAKGHSCSVITTSNEMKDRLTSMIQEQGILLTK
ncbi:hypothetical protein [Niallia endozanthoxylica]|uniref:Uncharacterized protein n=1 Tax=Niallia endozanthoxylica TaxID=2036016 RepID=A0A5J5HAP0_9BACI|nr:hypothetical protein [Niallia endozanthoxylica]KAA9016948.1 hypothetical protein F4V44_20985 [Niallia endozanthoxylica]